MTDSLTDDENENSFTHISLNAFLQSNSKADLEQNVHAALFHTVNVDCQKPKSL